MTSNQGGGTHPGDPWSPDWQPAGPDATPDDDWPYDESLTLSDAEIEIAGLDDDEEDQAVQESDALDTQAEAAEGEAEELAAREAEQAATAAREAEELAAREAEEAATAAREAEEAATAAREAEELAAREAEEAATAAREAEEAAAREAEEAATAAREAEELAAREAEEAVAREAEEAAAAAREAEEAAAREAEEAATAAREAEELAAREAEEAATAAREAEEAAAAAREAEELAAREAEPEPLLRAVTDDDAAGEPESDEVIAGPVEEIELEDLQAEPEWLEAVEEMTLDDIADAGDAVVESIDETPTAVIDAIAEAGSEVEADELDEMAEVVIEDATFEVVDLDDADLRADTAEHMFEVLDFEDDEDLIDHDEVTAEVPVASAPAPVVEAFEPAPIPDIAFEVPEEYELVVADVDQTRHALEAFMAAPVDLGQDAIILDDQEAAPAQVEEAEPVPLTPEEELIARLSGDLTLPDFETFVQEDFARDFAPEPTQEHRGLAESISAAEAAEPSALAVTMPGIDHGHVGFQDLDDGLHFDDPDAPEEEEPPEEPGEAVAADSYGSDLTLRVASGVILVALLAGTLWAGGIVFLLFISVVAVAAQIEFYTATRAGGYRPLVLFGLLGGIGALIGTYVQGSDVLRQGPVAIPAALGLTVVATFAWYGSQETPPRHPWRNGLVTLLGVAWIPALLALVFPMAELPRSDRFSIIIVLLLAVAAFDVGSYFVGRALGSRKLSPSLSPNKTVEGLIGGVVATVIVALLAATLVSVFDFGTAMAVAAGVIIAAPLGDLAESLVKRSLGIKDMGQIIPGHGGVLDRIDSYLFAVPVAYLVLRWTGLL